MTETAVVLLCVGSVLIGLTAAMLTVTILNYADNRRYRIPKMIRELEGRLK